MYLKTGSALVYGIDDQKLVSLRILRFVQPDANWLRFGTKEMFFFLFLIEKYATAKERPTGDVLREWDQKEITKEIFDSYFQYHQEGIENAYADIDCLVSTRTNTDYGASEFCS